MLASEPPIPPNFGLRLRTLHLTRQLARAADVELAYHSRAIDVAPDASGEDFELTKLRAAWGEPRIGWVRTLWLPWDVGVPKGGPLREHAARNHHDTVVAHTLAMLRVAAASRAPTIYDAHNVMTHVARTMARADSRPAGRARWWWEAAKTAAYERRVLPGLDAVVACSDADAACFERWGARRVVVVPNGVDVASVPHQLPATEPSLLYIGHFAWRPNVEAANELVGQVLPRVRATRPEATLTLVGADPRGGLDALKRQPGVEFAGRVDSVLPYLRRARAMVVPLRAGGGTRLKVLEALAAGVPVVSTRFGVSGLGLEDGRHVLIADDAPGLAAQAVRLLEDDGLARALSLEGRALVERRCDWTVVARPLLELNERLAARGAA